MRTELGAGDFTSNNVLDLARPKIAARLKSAMRGKSVSVAFWIPNRKETHTLEIMTVLLAEGLKSPYAHCEIWLDETIGLGTIAVGQRKEGTIQAYYVDQGYEWDVVKVCICSDALVDNLLSIWAKHAPYSAHKWRFLLPHQLLVSDHYRAEDTRTWTEGLSCSQFVLLFLKRCAPLLKNFDCKDCNDGFWDCDSLTCLPDQVMTFLKGRIRPFTRSKHLACSPAT
jgi:hypothetical protein